VAVAVRGSVSVSDWRIVAVCCAVALYRILFVLSYLEVGVRSDNSQLLKILQSSRTIVHPATCRQSNRIQVLEQYGYSRS
jgi:hypothetical protein